MEHTATEIQLSQEQCISHEQSISQLHARRDCAVNSGGGRLEKDSSGTLGPRRWAGRDHLRHDKSQIPVCRDNFRGTCARGASCKYRHSEYGEHDGPRFHHQYERGRLGTVANSENSQYRNEDNNTRTDFSSGGVRSRSPCRRFQSGTCYRGAACPYLHVDFIRYDRPTNDSRSEEQIDGAARVRRFGNGSRDNTPRMPQGQDEADKENNARIMSFSGQHRSRSPCRNFLRGQCSFGTYCKRWHPANPYVRTRHEFSSHHHQGPAETSSNPDCGEGHRNVTLRTSLKHDESNMHNHLRTSAFSKNPSRRSPCRNFLSGKCYRGESCVHLHPVGVYNRERYDSCRAQQPVRSSQFVNGNVATTSRISQNHEDIKNHVMLPRRDMQVVYGQDKGCAMKDGMQLVGSRENMDATSRSWSSERQRSRYASDFGGDKLIREVCLRYTKGRCTLGDSCRYLHGYHAYASSDWNKNAKEAAGNSRNSAMVNRCTNTMMVQEHDGVRNCNMLVGDNKHTERNEKETRGWSVNETMELKFPDQKGGALLMDGHQCEKSGEKKPSFCSSTEGHEDFSLWSRPFKRRRSRSGSPSPSRDDFRCSKFRRYDSRIDLRRDRCYGVARFQYPDRSSYKCERPTHHANGQQRLKGEATSVNPCFREASDTKFGVPNRCDEVVSQGLQLDQCSNILLVSNIACASRKSVAESATCASPPRHRDQNGEQLVTDSIPVDRSQNTEAVSQGEFESDPTSSCDEDLVSPEAIDLSMLGKKGNIGVTGILDQAGDGNAPDFMSAMKTYCRKKRRKRCCRSVSCEDGMKEIADPSKHVIPTSSCIPELVSVPGIPVNVKARASKNNLMEDMLLHDHPAELQENEMMNKICKTAQSELATTEDGTMLVGNTDSHSLQASQSSLKASVPVSKRKLLVLDVNGLLADIVAACPHKYKPDTTVSGKAVFKRPFCDDFLQFCFERFDVGIWSSRTKKNVTRVVDFLLKDTKNLLFCWDQSHCTATGYNTIENREKPLVLKELRNLWDNKGGTLPWSKGYYNETNTVLLDDSPYKALRNPPYTAIFPHPYSFKHVQDKSLGPGGELRVYLESLAGAENVQKFIQENPFGQNPITDKHPSWTFYAKIIGASEASHPQESAITTP